MNFNQHAGMNLVYRNLPLSAFLSTQQSLEVRNIEFWAGYPHFSMESSDSNDRKALHALIRSCGLQTIAVTVPSLGYQYQYCPVSKEMRQKCWTYFQRGLYLAAELNAPIMTVNSGWSYYDQPQEAGFQWAGEFLNDLCAEAKRHGIKLALESLTPLESNLATTISTTQQLLEYVGNDNLYLTIDTGACACSGETSRMWFDTFGKRIIHSHFIDGKANHVGHLIWGSGTLDLIEELKAYENYGYQGYLSAELASGIYGNDPSSADRKNVEILRDAFPASA